MMAETPERVEQESFIGDDGSLAQPAQGPEVSPPAPLHTSTRGKRGETSGRPGSPRPTGDGEQLPLPLAQEPESSTAPPAGKKRRRRKAPGFVPVTRDPDVARSYSDSAALDSAIAQGLAQVLTRLPPEELAALRAKVAQAARKNGRAKTS